MTIKEAMEHCLDMGYFPEVFKDDVGLDITIPGFITKPSWFGEEREVKLVVSIYRGISWDAVHYYGSLQVRGVHFSNEAEPRYITVCEETRKAERENSLASSRYDIDVVRPVTQEEIDENRGRWSGYKAGDKTNAFYTKSEIIDLAKQICKARFEGNWKLIIDDGDNTTEILVKDL